MIASERCEEAFSDIKLYIERERRGGELETGLDEISPHILHDAM